jgi:hypothetical protein
MINILDNFPCSSGPICLLEVFMNPLDQVIFEYTLDELMEDVGCEQFMDISSRESVSEWLRAPVREN